MLIAQISDLHLTEDGVPGFGGEDPGVPVAATIEAIRALEVQPDLVLCTGDLAFTGTAGEYARIRSALSLLTMPVFPLVGNHDDRALLAEAFGLERQGEFVQYVVDDFPVRIIVLDTLTPGSIHPSYCETRLAWLRSVLSSSTKPTVLAMHHPPFPEGVRWIRPADPSWSRDLATLLTSAPYVKRIVSGHVHRTMQRIWNGVNVSTAPSIAPHAVLNLDEKAPALLDRESPGFQLLKWENDEFTTYTVSVAGFLDRFVPQS
jgi:3',5'-cyclic-AMP phosphodiesterase